MRSRWLSQTDRHWQDVRVLVRLDLNVPIQDGVITDFSRIDAVTKKSGTLSFLIKRGAKVIILAHLGRHRPGKPWQQISILQEPLAKRLRKAIGRDVSISCLIALAGPGVTEQKKKTQSGQVLLLENCRCVAEDEANSPTLADELAKLADVFIFDGFGVAHRKHASTTGVMSRMENYLGILVEEEITKLESFTGALPGSVACVGGGKLKEKIGLLAGLLANQWDLILGGVPLIVALKVKGIEIGDSVCTEEGQSYDEPMAQLLADYGCQIHLPQRLIIAEVGHPECTAGVEIGEGVSSGWQIVDFFLEGALEPLLNCPSRLIQAGPMGWFEKGFHNADHCLAKFMRYNHFALALGADTVAATKFERFSTGGGSAIYYISKGTLPILEI